MKKRSSIPRSRWCFVRLEQNQRMLAGAHRMLAASGLAAILPPPCVHEHAPSTLSVEYRDCIKELALTLVKGAISAIAKDSKHQLAHDRQVVLAKYSRLQPMLLVASRNESHANVKVWRKRDSRRHTNPTNTATQASRPCVVTLTRSTLLRVQKVFSRTEQHRGMK